jgi:ABC-type Na+ efflux pump permease subunit
MKNILKIVGLVATVALLSSVPTFAADVAADAAQVARQAASIPAIKQSAATAAGYKATDLEVTSTAHKITITVVNSKLNAGLPTGRSNEASKIMQALEKSIAGRAEFGQVMAIHLDYVSRQGRDSKIIQGFDFNKSPSGSFVPHAT